jgi:acyl-CoA-binding protein
MSAPAKPILVLDFDGVIHSYASPWRGAAVIPDPPVPGALEALELYAEHFQVAIFSSRTHQPGGRQAMQQWLYEALIEAGRTKDQAAQLVYHAIVWPTEKPPALVTIDDRAVTFTGSFPAPAQLLAFKPWNKMPPQKEKRRGQ